MSIQTILVRYRDKGGQLKFEFISGTNVEIEAILKGYLSSKDSHSLMILGSTSSTTTVDVNLGLTVSTEFPDVLITENLHHWLIHRGDAWIGSDVDNDVDIIAPKYWHIRCTTGHHVHMVASIFSNTAGLVELFEGGEVSAYGTGVPVFNVHRPTTGDCEGDLCRDPTVTQDGTRIFVARVGTQTSRKIGGEITQGQFVLKTDTTYLIKFTPDANNAIVSLSLDFFHEETEHEE